eukprot:15367207-Ditylum_brightwellii.AAC.4
MGNHKRRALSKTDLKFQHPSRLDQLTIYVDATHATDIKSRQSIGGHVALMAGTAIAYSAKWHQTASTSFTGAEFIQATSAAKMAKCICAILKELKMGQDRPTMIYEDNATAIMMANTIKPNGRTRHIDISYFAIQEWVENDNIELAHIQGVANPSNVLTKALGWTLHQCHVTRMMGHTGCKHTCTSGKN